MQEDIYLSDKKVKLAQPIKYMPFYVYEIMCFAEILPKSEQKKALKNIMIHAYECGAFKHKTKFKHNMSRL